MVRRIIFFAVVFSLLAGAPAFASNGTLSTITDLISTSAPGVRVTHTLTFTLQQAIPPSGSIEIIPENAFTIPASFDYSAVQFSVWNGGSWIDRPLLSAPDSVDDGVSVVSGSSGSITVTLNSTVGLNAGDQLRMIFASATSSNNLINPGTVGSYRVRIYTRDQSGTQVDYGATMLAIVEQVGVNLEVIQLAPIRSNGLPQGQIAANNKNIELSLNTDELATCRYSTASSTDYDAMTNEFLPSLAQTFYTVVTDQQNSTTYTYFVRCKSSQGVKNDSDYVISYTLGPDPISNTSIANTNGSSGRGGVGPYPNGSDVLYLSSVHFAGIAPPGSTITVLTDGGNPIATQAGGDGSFRATIGNLERGTYTFLLYASDRNGNKSAPVTETFSVGQGSDNSVTGILMPPTVVLASNTVDVGKDATVSGSSIPKAKVELTLQQQSSGGAPPPAAIYSASSTSAGDWNIAIPGKDLSAGTYMLKARTIVSADQVSDYSGTVLLGVGGAPSAACSGAKGDLNGDGKINLIDFSIMLTQWQKGGSADLNCDGSVNLADFSILLFNWTG